MTIGSAASLPGHGPEAPLPTFRSFRRPGRLSVVPGVNVAEAPDRHVPAAALADDPPRGRILVVADQAPLALELQRILRDAGYRAVGPVASAEDAERLAGPRRFDGAIVDRQLAAPEAAAVAEWLADNGIPFVWLIDAPFDSLAGLYPDAPTVAKPVKREALVRALDRAMSAGDTRRGHNQYPVPPPQPVWPRVFPQL